MNVLCFILITAIQCAYGHVMYKLGIKHGVARTIVNVLTDNDIIKESIDEK